MAHQSFQKTNTRRINPFNIVGVLLIVIFLPIIIVNIVIVVKSAIHPDQIPMVFDTAPLIVLSPSMTIDKKTGTGAFNEGDLIFIRKVNPENLNVGDIITYKEDDGLIVTHRIIAMYDQEGNHLMYDGEKALETKGDYNSPVVSTIKYSQIIGIYKSRIAGIGNMAMFLQTPMGILTLLGIPLFVILLVDWITKNKEKKKNEKKTAELEAELSLLKQAQAASLENQETKDESPL